MIPQTLIVRNFMCYRDDVPELKLDGINIACLSGENGAGKSALLDAITWVLWGKARMSDEELLAVGTNEMEVDLRFDLSGQQYRVFRKYQRGSGKRSGKGSLDFQVRNNGAWKALGEQQIRQTEEKIVDLLRMKYDTFINSAFLLQGRADEFTRKAPAERKQVLADILDLSEYARLEQQAKDRVKELNNKIIVLDSKMELLRQEANKQSIYLQAHDEARERVIDLTDALERATARLKTAEERVRELDDARRQQRERQIQLEKLQQEQQESAQQRAELQATIAAAEATLARQDAIKAGMVELDAARAELDRLEKLRDHYDELEAHKRELKEALIDERNSLRGELEKVKAEAQRLQDRKEYHLSLLEQIAASEARIAQLAPLAHERDQLRSEREALEARRTQLFGLVQQQTELQGRIKQRQDSLVATREEKKRLLRRLDQQLADEARLRRQLEDAQEQHELLLQEREQLGQLKIDEQTSSDDVIDLRSECQAIKAQADALKERQALLSDDAASCPVCGSELGHEGIAQVRAHFDAELAQLRADYAARKKGADAGEKQLKTLRADIQVLEGQINQRLQATSLIEGLTQQLAQLAAIQKERVEVVADLASVEEQIEAKSFDAEAQAALDTLEAKLMALGGDSKALEQELRTLDQQLRDLETKLREQGTLEGTLAQQRRELAAVEKEVTALPEVEQRAEQLAHTLESNNFALDIRAKGKLFETELQELGYTPDLYRQARTHVDALAHWQEEQRQLANADSKIELSRFRLKDLTDVSERRAAEIEQVNDQIATFATTIQSLRNAPAEREQANLDVSKQKLELVAAQNDFADKKALLRRANESAAKLLEHDNERRGLLERLSIFEELAVAYGKKGLQAMLIETAIPEIEREANFLLGRMTDNQMHVTVETQRETRKGEAQETLEIKIADALGTRAYDAFSGGESFRVNFAIRIALSKLLARRAGARLETLVIDEGFGALDARGRERLVEAISSVQQDFKRILVITHIQELKDLFPTQIEVTKTPEGSKWQLV